MALNNSFNKEGFYRVVYFVCSTFILSYQQLLFIVWWKEDMDGPDSQGFPWKNRLNDGILK